MFLKHFGFHEQPFGTTPDPKFLYFSAEHSEALAALHYGLTQRRGFQVLIARPGMGKTTLLHYLLERWKGRAATAFVFHPPETREQMIAAVLQDLGLASAGSYAESCRLLHAAALDCRRRNKRLLAVFDEAQCIPAAVLEEIRLLSNFETCEEKLIEVILAGQPALAQRLEAPACEQLRQRVSTWARLSELDREEVRRYVEHRLQLAGCRRKKLFTNRALERLAHESQGIPRNINALCFEALSSALGEGKGKAEERHVPGVTPGFSPRRTRWVTGAVTATLASNVLLGSLYLHYQPTAEGQGVSLLERLTVPVSAAPPEPAPLPAPALPIQSSPSDEPRPEESAAPEETPDGEEAEPTLAEVEQVRVQPSDTLQRIALRQYGRWGPEVWKHIHRSNAWLVNPNQLKAGQTLVLPSFEAAPDKPEVQP